MTFGYKKYKILGDGFQKFYRLIVREKIPAVSMREEKDYLFLKLSAEYCKDLERICSENGYEFEITGSRGLVNVLRFLKGRPGIIAGFIITIAAMIYMSNIALRFDVLCDDEKIKQDVMTVLEEEGIKAGTYIPDINLAVTERALKQRVEGISWAGITIYGNSVIVDVVKNIESPKFENERLPTNLVACENAVIDKLEVFGGQVMIGVGSGVSKGDIIVSGKVVETKSKWIDGKEDVKVRTSYTRSKGKVYGTFERTVTFEQPFEQVSEYDTGEILHKKYISFFSADIPLFIDQPEGYYKSSLNESRLRILGFETPLSVKDYTLKGYDFKSKKFTAKQAWESLNSKIFKYETNFLHDYEIKDRKLKKESYEKGVRTTVTYTLYGVISREAEFFINKGNNQ